MLPLIIVFFENLKMLVAGISKFPHYINSSTCTILRSFLQKKFGKFIKKTTSTILWHFL